MGSLEAAQPKSNEVARSPAKTLPVDMLLPLSGAIGHESA
jgi:hypothetical protein